MAIVMDSKSNILIKAWKEVVYLGIADMILGCVYLACITAMGAVSDFHPHVAFWICIVTCHAIHITAAATLVTGNLRSGNKATKFAVCKFWLLNSRFILRWFFPLECLLILIVVYGNTENDLVFTWILFIIVEEVFLYLAISSVNSYNTLLKISENGDNITATTPSPSNTSVIDSTTTSTDNIVQQS